MKRGRVFIKLGVTKSYGIRVDSSLGSLAKHLCERLEPLGRSVLLEKLAIEPFLKKIYRSVSGLILRIERRILIRIKDGVDKHLILLSLLYLLLGVYQIRNKACLAVLSVIAKALGQSVGQDCLYGKLIVACKVSRAGIGYKYILLFIGYGLNEAYGKNDYEKGNRTKICGSKNNRPNELGKTNCSKIRFEID